MTKGFVKALLISVLITFSIFQLLSVLLVHIAFGVFENDLPSIGLIMAGILALYMLFIWPLLQTKIFLTQQRKSGNFRIFQKPQTFVLLFVIFEISLWIGLYLFYFIEWKYTGKWYAIINYQSLIISFFCIFLVNLAVLFLASKIIPQLKNTIIS